MAEVIMTGILYDKHRRTVQNVVFIGEAGLQGYAPGHPLPEPPPGGGNGDKPPTIWGPGDPRPQPPIAFPPGWVGGVPPILPVPPDVQVPPPGSPPVIMPGATPTHPIQPPSGIFVDYPGIGRVLVPQPLTAEPKPA